MLISRTVSPEEAWRDIVYSLLSSCRIFGETKMTEIVFLSRDRADYDILVLI